MTRVESPHSLNVFTACPRKYFYKYYMNLPETTGIAALNGNIVHSTLEDFYTFDHTTLKKENGFDLLRHHLLTSFHTHWTGAIPKLKGLHLKNEEIKGYYEDSLSMLDNFFKKFAEQLQLAHKSTDMPAAFLQVKPETELHFHSEKYQLQGYIDAIQKKGEEVMIIDYKTSRSDEVSEEYRLQLAIYALLYKEKQGILPTKVGLYFLRKNTEKFLEVTDALVQEAENICRNVHEHTISTKIEDYPKKIAQHCRYCDFQVVCFGQKSLADFHSTIKETGKAKDLNPNAEAGLAVGR